MSDDTRDNDSSLGDALLGGVMVLVVLAFILLAALSIFLFGPGMAVVGLVRLWGVAVLDTGQTCTFAITVSLALVGFLALLTGGLRNAAKAYSGISVSLIAVLLLLRFGFKESGPETLFHYYFPEGKAQAAEAAGAAPQPGQTR